MARRQRPGREPHRPARQPSWMIGGAVVVIIVALILLLSRTSSPPPMTGTTASSSGIPEFTAEGELTIMTGSNEHIVSIEVEIAETDNERMLGLMYRRELDALQGMLFLFPYEDVQSFWMKNTVLPLDILFINSRREIITIHQNTTPNSERSYASVGRAQYVLEVNAGFVERHHITVGDKVQWRRM